MRYVLVTISDDPAQQVVRTVRVTKLECGLSLITASCGHEPPTALPVGQDNTMIAERMPDAPTPTRPGPDKPEVVAPRTAPDDTKKPKRGLPQEPPKEPEVKPEPQTYPVEPRR